MMYNGEENPISNNHSNRVRSICHLDDTQERIHSSSSPVSILTATHSSIAANAGSFILPINLGLAGVYRIDSNLKKNSVYERGKRGGLSTYIVLIARAQFTRYQQTSDGWREKKKKKKWITQTARPWHLSGMSQMLLNR